MTRLRRSDCSEPGITRRRSGRGFAYHDADGERITERDVIARIKALGIPPAWEDVWICPDENGHLQATGTDEQRSLKMSWWVEQRRPDGGVTSCEQEARLEWIVPIEIRSVAECDVACQGRACNRPP